MSNFEDEEFYRQHPEVSKMFRIGKLEEMLNEVRSWKKEGKTKEEILSLIDRQVLVNEDIEKIFDETEEFSNEDAQDNSNIEEKVEVEKIEEENEIDKTNKADKVEIESIKKDITKKFEYLSDEELIDYENQPFMNNNEDDNEQLCNSIKLNGIIEPIVVRPFNGKYQILSGHRRRMCGKKVGLKKFPCLIEDKTDDEAAVFLVDTNLVSRKNLKPTEIAKAFRLREKALKNLKRINGFTRGIRETISEENGFSLGNVQRYLRVNYLVEELQNAVDCGKMPLKIAEHISFLGRREQNMIKSLVCDENKKITETQAKKLKRIYQDETQKIDGDRLRELLELDVKKKKNVTICFEENEIEKYFNGQFDKKYVKNTILKKFEMYKSENGE